ncbi:MAG: hypothetical protein MUC47_02665 [Candidatus Kapabacteria bacterium]|jgi:hypothetical protein|nr:hypothetical protein [Candidatus Kapabacteria bacterium]
MLHRVFFFLGLLVATLSMMVLVNVVGNMMANDGKLTDIGLAVLFFSMLTGGSVVALLAHRVRKRLHVRVTAIVDEIVSHAGYVEASVVAMRLRCSLDDAVATLDEWAERRHYRRVQLPGYDVRYLPPPTS